MQVSIFAHKKQIMWVNKSFVQQSKGQGPFCTFTTGCFFCLPVLWAIQ